jgi:diguanylate cyclase (GGDEF)-like protein
MRSVANNDTRAAGPRPSMPCAALLALVLTVSGHPAAGAAPAALELPTAPPVARFAPDLDGVVPENFAVAQDGDGVAYLGNRHGVLVFDGERWTLVPSPNGDLVRSLAWDGAGRVYVGGYDQIGWVERDAQGAFVYHDLRPSAALRADERFADIWETHVLPQGVFFRGLHHVFRYDPASGRIALWRHPTRFGALALDGDELVLQFRPLGLRRLVGEEWQPIPGTESFGSLVERWIKLADGRLLGLRKDGRWATYRHGVVGELSMPAGVGPPTDYTRGVLLDDGTLALSGDDGTLRLVDLAQGRTNAFDVTGGGFISGLLRARDGGLLLSADSGLYHVDWPTPWTALDRADASGSLQGFARWGERRVLLTGAGAYELARGADGDARFEPRPWAQHPTWDLLEIDARTALLAENYALRLVDARGAREISAATLYPRVLQRSRFDPDVVFVGTELGFTVVRRAAAGWRPVFVLDDIDAPNVSSFVETERGELMLGSERGGARRLRFADDWQGLREQRVFEAADGIDYGPGRKAWLARFGALGIVASTATGLYQWDGRRFVASDLGGLGALRGPQQTLALAEGPDGARWAWDFARIFRQAPGGAWQREDIDAVREGAIDRVAFDADGRTLFVANGSVLRHDPLARPAGVVRPRLRLASVERVDETGARARLPLEGSVPVRLVQGDFGINFKFATPELRRVDGARYRARLVGYGEPFSEWSRSSGFTYSRLQPGAYRLELYARDARGSESDLVSYEFEIVPRWYATGPALAAWALLGLALLGSVTRWAVRRRTHRLAVDKRQLETMVEARTRELADANRKLDTIAHLDGLTGIPNRRKLDEYLEQVWALCAERERPLAVLAIDVDRFKDYNDRHGHLAGDALLKRLAPILTRNLRRTEDLAARYGGEEFLVVLPGADAEVAREVAEALREKVGSSSIGATISVGVAAETPRSGRAVTELVALADAALYRAKEAGRNRVVVSGA